MSEHNIIEIKVGRLKDDVFIKYTPPIEPNCLFNEIVPYLPQSNNTDIKWNKVKMILHPLEVLSKGQPLKKEDTATFGQDLLEKDDSEEDPRCPLIHIPLSNVFEIHENEHMPTYASRTYNIMDSSIWNYMVPFLTYNYSTGLYEWNKDTFIDKLKEVLKKIENNYRKGLYKLSVAYEYANLNARLTTQAFLTGGGHSAGVSPFIFHSEKEIEKLILSEFVQKSRLKTKSTIDQIKDHKWRILLVDDKATNGMGTVRDYVPEIIDGLPQNSKLAIIKSLLKEQKIIDDNHRLSYPSYDESIKDHIEENTCFRIEYAENVAEAQKLLRKKKYDIVLLDYLLVADDKDDNKKRYGYQLLESIYSEVSLKHLLDDVINILLSSDSNNPKMTDSEFNDICELVKTNTNEEALNLFGKKPYDQIAEKALGDSCRLFLLNIYKKLKQGTDQDTLWKIVNKVEDFLLNKENITSVLKTIREAIDSEGYKIGPRKRIFFIFISAYSSAVYERLLAEGLNQSEDYWHIAIGACPTNTPQLFLYNLIKLMEKRLEDSGILKLSSDEIFELINKIYLPKEKDIRGDSVRKRANALYQKVLSLQYHYRNILKDVEIPLNASVFETKGSVLMTNFIQKKINLGGMLEHLTQLVHLTAFGTVRQWPEMWEEYCYFKAMFEKQQDEFSLDNFNSLCQNIENYILELKSQQQ